MPDFEAMTDAELRAFKSAKAGEIREAREQMLLAEGALQAKRRAADAKWHRAAVAARDDFRLGSNEDHDAKTRELFEMSDADMEAAIAAAAAVGGLSREERRARARAGSAHVIAPPTNAGARVPITEGVLAD